MIYSVISLYESGTNKLLTCTDTPVKTEHPSFILYILLHTAITFVKEWKYNVYSELFTVYCECCSRFSSKNY